MFRPSPRRATTLSLLSAAVLAAPCVHAQRSNRENSPYSRYGLGEQRPGSLSVPLRGMGGASAAYTSPLQINADNPATYGTLRLTTYEGAAEGGRRVVSAGGESYTTGTATPAYVRVGIPLGKYGGMALGFHPETRVFYRLQSDTLQTLGFGRTLTEYRGEGGTNYAFIGAAGTYGGFSLGANVGYLFGNIENASFQQFLDNDTARTFAAGFRSARNIGGIYAKGGAHYEGSLNKDLRVRVGATAAWQQSVDVRQRELQTAYRGTSAFLITDTAYSADTKGTVVLPLRYSVGIGLAHTEKWGIYADYAVQQSGDFRSFDQPDSLAPKASRIGLGAEFTPDNTSRDYLSRITYRLGVQYGQDIVKLRGQELDYFSVTGGASLPFRRSSDRIHLALEGGRRGTQTAGLVRENFLRLSVGISFNDRWFVKRKYD